MAALDTATSSGTSALNTAIKACSDFDSLQDFKDKIVSDCAEVDDATTFLRDYCGIIFGNTDTGAITGSGAGNATVKSAKSVVPENGDLINFTGNEFTIDGLTVKLGKSGAGSVLKTRDFSNLSAQEQYLWQSLYSYWMEGSLALIADSYGDNFSFNDKSSAATKTMYIVFNNSDDGILASTWGGPNYTKKSTNDLEIHINLKFYGTATGVDGIPTGSNQTYLDRTLAHELTHAVMRANIDYFDYLPKWLKEGMAELTHGADDKRTADLRTLAGNSNLLRRALSDLNSTSVTNPAYSGGYLALRYLAKQAADSYVKTFSGSNDADQFETFNDYVTIDGGGGSDTLGNGFYTSVSYSLNGGDYVYLRGGDGNDSILNCVADSVTINGGAGDDSIQNRDGNVLIIYAAGDGNDWIQGFNETSTLSVGGAPYSSRQSGDDLILTVGDGSITLGNASTLDANIIGTSTTLTLTNDDNAKQTLPAQIVKADAAARTKITRIVGNELDNTILGGSKADTIYGKDGDDYVAGNNGNDKILGQNGDDTLWGGKGADTLTGGKGNDLFVYTAGKDVIADYESGDKISLGADVTGASLKGSDSVLKFGSGTLTVKKASALTLIDAEGTELTTIIGSMTLDNTAGASTLPAQIFSADASTRTKAIKIVGNALANTILGGAGNDKLYGSNGDDSLIGNAGKDYLHGGNGNDTLWGGAGNDTLIGGAGVDTFIYTAGKDVITDFADNDLLQITGTFAGTYSSSANTVAFKVGSTARALTLKDFTASNFNINGDDYQISGTKLVKK